MSNSFNDIFKNLSKNLYCPSCGSKYSGTEISSIIKNEQGYLVSVNCTKCQLTVMVNVVTHKDFSNTSFSTVTSNESITTDNVIDFYNELKVFDGNFRHSFNKN